MVNVDQARIMIVDDVPKNLEVLQQMLQTSGYKVSAFPNGRLALEAIKRNPPDLILLDIRMPEMSGYEVCQKLKSDTNFSWIPVIFLSALREVGEKIKAFEMGGDDYITKPFQFEEVQARVNTHLKLSRALIDLKKQNELLAENLRLREDVERITRHDLKTPLSAAMTIPDILLQDRNITPDQAELLEILRKAGRQMHQMISESLDFYKMEHDEYELKPVKVEILKVIRQIISELVTGGFAPDVNCFSVCIDGINAGADDKLFAPGEELLFYTMFSNLIKNAIEASDNTDTVKINLHNSNPLQVDISNAREVPEAIKDRFFDKYTTHGKKQGTGLGTYSSMLVAKTLGGNLTLDSNKQQGTTVSFSLPIPEDFVAIEAKSQSNEELPVKSRVKKQSPKLLIVDDSTPMRILIKMLLKKVGLTDLTEAENGQEAISALQNDSFDLIISDWNMPVKSGIDVFNHVKSSMPDASRKFLLISGETFEATRKKAENSGIENFLLKPFPPDALRAKIQEILSA